MVTFTFVNNILTIFFLASLSVSLDTSVKKALDDLKEGETSDVIETDSALYIVRLDSETDKDATEKNRQNIIDKRKSDLYNEVLEVCVSVEAFGSCCVREFLNEIFATLFLLTFQPSFFCQPSSTSL